MRALFPSNRNQQYSENDLGKSTDGFQYDGSFNLKCSQKDPLTQTSQLFIQQENLCLFFYDLRRSVKSFKTVQKDLKKVRTYSFNTLRNFCYGWPGKYLSKEWIFQAAGDHYIQINPVCKQYKYDKIVM